MTILSELKTEELSRRLLGSGINLQMGPFHVSLTSNTDGFAEAFFNLYRSFPVIEGPFADFHCTIKVSGGIRRWLRPKVDFYFDNHPPFYSLPANQALPMVEWGLNWCIANHAHTYLQLHAAGLEKNGVMIIMPAPPGSGKSTLTAALMTQGWRLLSDEIVLIRLSDGLCYPLSRPVNLKNNSIEIYKSLQDATYLSPVSHDTAKGTVALAQPTTISVKSMDIAAEPTHVIFPRYESGSELICEDFEKGLVVLDFIRNSFNYHMLGSDGFERVTEIVKQCRCLKLTYSRLTDAFDFFDSLDCHAAN